MAAIDTTLISRSLEKRDFAKEEPGVIVVFAIVGAVALLLIYLFIQKKIQARNAAKA